MKGILVPAFSFGLAGAFSLGGLAVLLFPFEMLDRTAGVGTPAAAFLPVARGAAASVIALALALVAALAPRRSTGWQPVAIGLVSAVPLVIFAGLLSDWWIDDAGITFAYSRSLAEGLGLVAQPWLPPEEGFSSPLWMLILSASHLAGFDIPATAKALGIGAAAACAVAVSLLVSRRAVDPVSAMAAGLMTACAPFVVWASSGQEHALQALLLVAVVAARATLSRWRPVVAILLALYVLTRPEAPLIVMGACAAVALSSEAATGRGKLAEGVLLGLPALAAFAGVMAFRLLYFGDPFSNPYYAKASEAGFDALLNPFSGGWQYLLSGLGRTGLLLLVGAALAGLAGRADPADRLAFGVIVAQVVFIGWAGGDWMQQFRFLMPVVPLIVLLGALGLAAVPADLPRRLAAIGASMAVLASTVPELSRFHARPTTPLSVVQEIGDTFADLADRMGIADPLLAHHDAGAIAYSRTVRLLDLGGLLSRPIARNMGDRAFLQSFIVDEQRPDFVFGAYNFAAMSGFAETREFAEAYVRLSFVDQPVMDSDLSYIRRDIVREAPGVAIALSPDGTIAEVVVRRR